MPVEVLIEDDRWEAAGLESMAGQAVGATLAHLGLDFGRMHVGLMGCDDARIAALNADFRGKPRPTNVLSWPSEDRAPDSPGKVPDLPDAGSVEDPAELGDIALAFDTCLREAREGGLAFEDHVRHLIVHGTLHLLGFDHEDDADAELMEARETEILASLGVADPYV